MGIAVEFRRCTSIKGLLVAGAAGLFAIGGFTLATTGAGPALSAQASVISVDRTNKSDRLPAAQKPVPTSIITTLARPPVGCEPAFSRTADPARAHIFGRCIS
jgi:hypothetical protein